MNNFQKWQNQDSPSKNRIVALGIGALIFPIMIPACLLIVFPQVDRYFGFGSFYNGWANILIGGVAILLGGALALWTIVLQIQLASGTPLPMLPTKKLLTIGPFKYCRNPMNLGTITAYFGVAILIGSYSALLAVAILAALLLSYCKFIEEKELEIRFGSEYIEYKQTTPFIIPIKIGKSESKNRYIK
jgi:protein-S-isoprenylcysteine O-methyltransferase Ste14